MWKKKIPLKTIRVLYFLFNSFPPKDIKLVNWSKILVKLVRYVYNSDEFYFIAIIMNILY